VVVKCGNFALIYALKGGKCKVVLLNVISNFEPTENGKVESTEISKAEPTGNGKVKLTFSRLD
jgi:hypothetical protein